MHALERQLATQEAHRDDPIVALGGGAVGDLAGFVAATYMRGVPFVQVPTTLTAQVDAAIGGKTGVNLPEGKNLVGAFHQPVAVLADVRTIATLPDRAFRSGLAEVAKYALTLDPELLEMLEADPSPVARTRTLRPRDGGRAVRAREGRRGRGRRTRHRTPPDPELRAHARSRAGASGRVRRQDPRRGDLRGDGVRRPALRGARPSAVGSRRTTRSSARLARARDRAAPLPPAEEVLGALRMDKKYRNGVRFVLLEDVGRPFVEDAVPQDRLRAALEQAGSSAQAMGG